MIDIYEFLSPVTKYNCPVCGDSFSDYEFCGKHINKHSKPERILSYSADAGCNCPNKIIVLLTDGREAVYQMIHVLDKPEEVATVSETVPLNDIVEREG